LRETSLDDRLKKNLQAVRGLCAKASKVTLSTNLFSALARGESFRPNLSDLVLEDIYKILVEAATDSEKADPRPKRRIQFRLDKEALALLPHDKVLAQVDEDLIVQAVSNLLDNAGKYSFPSTVVRISASFTTDDDFMISVVNEGLRIEPADIPNCTERHWRGPNARLTTGEGSGLGLWIVNHIMEVHGGKLVIIPTTSANLTEVRLVFPGVEKR
jgi:signal transduction histidine kinase